MFGTKISPHRPPRQLSAAEHAAAMRQQIAVIEEWLREARALRERGAPSSWHGDACDECAGQRGEHALTCSVSVERRAAVGLRGRVRRPGSCIECGLSGGRHQRRCAAVRS